MDAVKTAKEPLKVLFLADAGQIPASVSDFLNDKSMSVSVLPLERFYEIPEQLKVIGTVIINAANLDANRQQQLHRIIELLDTMNIATILLDKPDGFEPGAVNPTWFMDYPLLASVSSDCPEELRGRISANLAYRTKTMQRQRKPETKDQSNDSDAAAVADILAEQLRMAGRVQRDFLPSTLPNSDRLRWATIFQPAEWVSGDIYDVARLDERHIGFYIADAVGHSMPAALLTMFLKQALVMRKTIGNKYCIFEPVEVVGHLNTRMVKQKLSGCQFATCCYCLLNTWTRELTFTRAGHPYPVLIRPTEAPRQLESRGALLGVFEHAQHKQQKIKLQSGDKLLLYSDGAEALIGRTDSAGRFSFTSDFCETAHLPVQQMIEKLDTLISSREPRRVHGQQPPLPYVDDITVIGVEIL